MVLSTLASTVPGSSTTIISNGDCEAIGSGRGGGTYAMRWAAGVLLRNGQFDMYGDNRSWYEKGAVGFVWNNREIVLSGVALAGYLLCTPTAGAGCVVGALASAAGTVSAGQREWSDCTSDLASFGCGEAVVSTGLGLVGFGAGTRAAARTSNIISSSPVLASPVFSSIAASTTQRAAISSARVWGVLSLDWAVASSVLAGDD